MCAPPSEIGQFADVQIGGELTGELGSRGHARASAQADGPCAGMLSSVPIRVSLRRAEIRMKADIAAASMVAGTFRWCASDLASRSKLNRGA